MKKVTSTFKKWLGDNGYNGKPENYLRYDHITEEYLRDIQDGYPLDSEDRCIND